MNSFQHQVIRCAEVKVMRDGRRIVIHVDASPMDRLTIEVEDGTLRVVEAADAALARKTGPQRIEL